MNRIESLMNRIARLERRHIQPSLGISAFVQYLEDILNSEDLNESERRLIQSFWGVTKSIQKRERKALGGAKTQLTPVLNLLESQEKLFERLRVQASGVVQTYQREMGQSGDQTTMYTPLKEAEIILNENLREHEKEVQEIKKLVEEAQSRLDVLYTNSIKNI